MEIEIPTGSNNWIEIDKDKWNSASESQKTSFYRAEENKYKQDQIDQDQSVQRQQNIEAENSTLGEKLSGTARGVGQGLTLGFGDEIEAGLKTGFGLLGNYDEKVGDIRDKISDFRVSDPGLAIGSEIGGAILPAIASGIFSGGTGTGAVATATAGRLANAGRTLANPVSKGISNLSKSVDKIPGASFLASKTPNLYQGMKTGAGYGAVYGTGTAESDPDANVFEMAKDRAKGLAGGGAMGMAFGGAINPVIAGGIKGGSAILDGLKKSMGNKNALERNVNKTILNASNRDGGKALSNIADDLDNPTVLADAGENISDLGYATQQVQNANRNNVNDTIIGRNNEQGARILDVVKSTANIGDDKLGYEFIDELAETTKRLSRPAYKEAYEINIPANKFKDFFTGSRKDTMLKASKIAKEELDIDGISVPALNKMWDSKSGTAFGSFDDIMSQDLSTEFLHSIKRGLDTMIKKETKIIDRAFKEVSPKGLKYTKLKNEFDEIIKNNNPTFKDVQKMYSSQKALSNAFERGKKYSSTSSRQIKKELSEMNPQEIEAWKSGMITKLEDVANDKTLSSNFLNQVDGSNKLNDIFKILLAGDPKKYEAFKNVLKQEKSMRSTFDKLRTNSNTNSKSKASEEFAESGKSVFDADGLYGLTRNIIREGIKKGKDVVSGGTNSERAKLISERLFTTSKTEQKKVLEALSNTNKELAKEVEKRLRSANTITRGLTIGSQSGD